jgi:type IX secretion system PorP/SprF family membrane protein
MKKSLLLSALIFVSFALKAQQDPQLTHWMFDRISFNPAAAGMDRMHNISIFYRNQWTGFGGTPKTFLGNYNGYYNLGALGECGIGGSFYNDRLGQETNNVFRGSFAKMFNVNGNTLAVGAALGMFSKALGNKWICSDPDDPTCRQDGAVPTNSQSQAVGDASIGLTYYSVNNYYLGVSMTHLPGSKLKKLNMQMARHAYLMGGKNFNLGSGPFVLRTNALVKTDLKSKPAIDVNANVLWNNMVWAGLSFRPGDAIAPMVGFMYRPAITNIKAGTTLDQYFMLGYSYDVTTSQIRTYSSGSHEIFLTYCWLVTKVPMKAKYGNPFFL